MPLRGFSNLRSAFHRPSSGSLINYYYHDYIRSRNLKENTHELESYGYLDTFAMYIIYKKIVDFISDS